MHLLVECLDKWPALKDALHLIKTWAFQRGFLATPKCPHFTSVDGFTLSLVAAHCTRAHSEAASTAAPQLFKLTMAFLARPQLLTHKWVFGRGGGAARGGNDPPQGEGALYDSDEETFNVLWRCGLHMQVQIGGREGEGGREGGMDWLCCLLSDRNFTRRRNALCLCWSLRATPSRPSSA